MMTRTVFAGTLAVLLAGCASAPLAPRIAVMPAPGKPFELFVAEERLCRQYAEQSVGGADSDPGLKTSVDTAVIGTAIGAVAGAAVGGRQGAAVGAAGGLIGGTAAGSGRAGYSERDIQRRYDIAYQQCMYAKGNQVPGYAMQQPAARSAGYPPPPPPPPASAPPASPGATPPPPPPGSPPPPPR
jgi:hypothetical protein